MATCKYGALKHPVGRRRCKKAPKGTPRKLSHRAALKRNIAALYAGGGELQRAKRSRRRR